MEDRRSRYARLAAGRQYLELQGLGGGSTRGSNERSVMNLHKEISFEAEICNHLAAHGWLYASGDAAAYDRARAMFPADTVAWVQAAQPAAWATLTKNHGAAVETMLLDRIRKQLDERGTLDV